MYYFNLLKHFVFRHINVLALWIETSKKNLNFWKKFRLGRCETNLCLICREKYHTKGNVDFSNSSFKGTFESLLASYPNGVQQQLISSTFERMKLFKRIGSKTSRDGERNFYFLRLKVWECQGNHNTADILILSTLIHAFNLRHQRGLTHVDVGKRRPILLVPTLHRGATWHWILTVCQLRYLFCFPCCQATVNISS